MKVIKVIIFILFSVLILFGSFVTVIPIAMEKFCYFTYTSRDALGHCNNLSVWLTYIFTNILLIGVLFLIFKKLKLKNRF
ncbi:MAG: hypothetical protein AAB656_03445 [Patescibacteria group bacterium]